MFVNVFEVDDDVGQIHEAGLPPILAEDHIERHLKRVRGVIHSKWHTVILERARMTHELGEGAILLANFGLPVSPVASRVENTRALPRKSMHSFILYKRYESLTVTALMYR